MQYTKRPCEADDCNNWIKKPELCKKCMDDMFTINLGFKIENDPCTIKQKKIENVAKKLFDYFGFNCPDGTYIYNLTRVKSAFNIGTMTLDDFEEIDEEFIYELAEYIVDEII